MTNLFAPLNPLVVGISILAVGGSQSHSGDHPICQINAGFCLGLLLDFPIPDAPALGVLFSGFHMRKGNPPDLADLPGFVSQLQDQPESNPKIS